MCFAMLSSCFLLLLKIGFWPVWLCSGLVLAWWRGVVQWSEAVWSGVVECWCPTSYDHLRNAERLLRQEAHSTSTGRSVPIGEVEGTPCHIWTLSANIGSPSCPILLIHGFGSASGLWCRNIDVLAKDRPVYAIDILGFGRSSRVQFPSRAVAVERMFVDSIERWRAVENVQRMIVVGHGFGGYLAASYAIKFPERVAHLTLVDPWGFCERPLEVEQRTEFPLFIKALGSLAPYIRPLGVIRLFGPLGPWLVSKLRPDLMRKFGPSVEPRTVSDYLYHCNAQVPSGEIAFHNLSVGFGWARHPMGEQSRLETLRKELEITLVYGTRSWVDRDPGFRVKYHRPDSYVLVEVIQGAGHHVYADRPENFNTTLQQVAKRADGRA